MDMQNLSRPTKDMHIKQTRRHNWWRKWGVNTACYYQNFGEIFVIRYKIYMLSTADQHSIYHMEVIICIRNKESILVEKRNIVISMPISNDKS